MFGRFPVKHSTSLKWHVQQSGGFLPALYQRCFHGHVSHRVGVPPRGVLNYNLVIRKGPDLYPFAKTTPDLLNG